jgi:hypothetical protein
MKIHDSIDALVDTLNGTPTRTSFAISDVVQFTDRTDPADRLHGEVGIVIKLDPDYVRVSLGGTYVDVRSADELELIESADVACGDCGRPDGTHTFWCGDPFLGLGLD